MKNTRENKKNDQMVFPWPQCLTAFGREDFFVTDCNRDAATYLDSPDRWTFPFVLIYGDKGCGKTHLAHTFSDNILQAESLTEGDILQLPMRSVVENVEQVSSEQILFHLYNHALANNKQIVFTARVLPEFHIADLQSRFNAMPQIKILPPDDLLMSAVLCKLFSERQVTVDADVIAYLLKHLQRTFVAMEKVVEIADQLSLSQKRAITIPLIKEALEQL